ncbi:D-lactate dehydrogenase [Acinetobacter qingfengensis]|uniref:D-lactate dehydrogenase n=1 Tax=Acinetobacter qingfengensis TaxID=1262585 RepID=A0A1E7QXG7_9GAMM|nr:D-lactate dehydrogenase [Acinetobacter qingfengensis]KAA8731675.1 D-lactate dehydrogenase [Acinetobacter qingfengensis]OEY91778.1 D-lactate dehydrogenase [Acinetobacter qingfengensis]
MSSAHQQLFNEFHQVVGTHQVLYQPAALEPYVKGFRLGHGKALAVIIPETLLQMWQILNICVTHDVIILMQAANTGVTGGSTPDGDDYDRDIVIISTRKIKAIQVIDDGKQVIAFPGSTLTELEQALKTFDREPHSVIGSSCIGASVIGGICNNSGGSLLHRGPAFTEKSLFAQIDTNGQLQLVNHLGIALGETPEDILKNLEQQHYQYGDQPDWEGKLWAEDYADNLRNVDSSQPTRFNGNPKYLHDSAGCSGKLAVFAVRLPTFEAPEATETFYIGSNSEAVFVALRRFLLQKLTDLPMQAEYIHRSAFELTVHYAKHMYRAIDKFGAARIPELFHFKNTIDRLFKAIPFMPDNGADRLIQFANRMTRHHVEPRIWEYYQQFEHHLILKTDVKNQQEMQQLLQEFFAQHEGNFFNCTPEEAKNAFLIRFAVGGCTIYYCESKNISTDQRLVAFDVALPANDDHFTLDLPPELAAQVELKSCCSHFFCYVVHQDYILKEGYNALEFKEKMIPYLEQRGAKYPAEHNVGHLYHASDDYVTHFKQLDPTNSFNSGIGKTSKNKFWR